LTEDERHGLGAFSSIGQEKAIEINEGLFASLDASEDRSESLVKVNQFLGRGADFICRHGGTLLNKKTSRLARTGIHGSTTIAAEIPTGFKGKVQL